MLFLSMLFWICAVATFQVSTTPATLQLRVSGIWGFPEIGVALNHPFNGMLPYKPSILGIPHDYGKPLYVKHSFEEARPIS